MLIILCDDYFVWGLLLRFTNTQLASLLFVNSFLGCASKLATGIPMAHEYVMNIWGKHALSLVLLVPLGVLAQIFAQIYRGLCRRHPRSLHGTGVPRLLRAVWQCDLHKAVGSEQERHQWLGHAGGCGLCTLAIPFDIYLISIHIYIFIYIYIWYTVYLIYCIFDIWQKQPMVENLTSMAHL